MNKIQYLCIIRSESGKCDNPSPEDIPQEEMEKMMTAFTDWQNKFQENDIDLGGQLGGGKVFSADGISDGPYTESKEIIGGYMVVSAHNIDEAVKIAQECPPIKLSGATVEVREILKCPGRECSSSE